jgi:hypothetical protein
MSEKINRKFMSANIIVFVFPRVAKFILASVLLLNFFQLNAQTPDYPANIGLAPNTNIGWYRPFYPGAVNQSPTGSLDDVTPNDFNANVNAYSLTFDGTDDYALPGNVSSTITDNFTMELWVKPASTIVWNAQSATGTAGTSGQKYAVFPTYGDTPWGANHVGAGISVGTNGISVYEHGQNYCPPILSYNGAISSTSFTHIAVVYTNKQPKLYINGNTTPVATGLTSSKTVHPSTQFGGGVITGNNEYFNGSLDEYRIWDVARTPTNIADNCNFQISTTTNLVRSWHMDEGTGSSTADASGNNGTATLNGPTWANTPPVDCYVLINNSGGTQINGKNTIYFNGKDSRLDLPDNSTINSGGPYAGKSMFMVFKTGSGVTNRQVLYEQGDVNKGLNIYIQNGLLYVNGYNTTDDDGGGPLLRGPRRLAALLFQSQPTTS